MWFIMTICELRLRNIRDTITIRMKNGFTTLELVTVLVCVLLLVALVLIMR